MAQVFNNPYTNSQVWSLQGGVISLIPTSKASGATSGAANAANGVFSDGSEILAATERIEIQIQRQVSVRHPLVGRTSVKVVSPSQGVCTLTTVIGPQHTVEQFLKVFGDACSTFTATVKTEAKGIKSCQTTTGKGMVLKMTGCTGEQAFFNMSAQQGIAVAQGTFRFVFDKLEWENGKD